MKGIPYIPPEERFVWATPAVFYYIGFMATWAICDASRKYNMMMWPPSLVFFHDNRCTFYDWRHEVEESGERAFRLVFSQRGRLRKERKEYSRIVETICKLSDSITPKYLRRLKEDELITFYSDYCRQFREFWYRAIIAELTGYGAEAYLSREITPQKYGPHAEEILNILTSPSEFSFFQEEEMTLLSLLRKIKAPSNSITRYQQWRRFLSDHPHFLLLLQEHARKYNWILNSYASCEPLPVSYFYRKAWQIVQKQEPAVQIRTIRQKAFALKRKRCKVINSLPQRRELRLFATHAGTAVSWHDHKKGVQLKIQRGLHYFLKEFSRRFEVEFQHLLSLFHWEIDDFLRTRFLDEKVIERRKNITLLYIRQSGVQLFYGRRAERIFAKYNQPVNSQRGEFTGTVVSRGGKKKIRGRVCILLDPRESARMTEGDILVAEMTSPDYIIAIKRAAAIVTNAGGLTSHAAVVSRELGIPCIVDTKIATQVLKDGDLVEVDTGKGMIRRLKKKKT